MNKITSLTHPLVKHLVKLRTNRDYRHEENAFVLENAKIIEEVKTLASFKTILVSHPELIPEGIKAKEIILTSQEVIQKISGVLSPEGIIAEVIKPKEADLKGKKRLLALDQIADPGNLGTILRTALAFDFDGIYLLDNCCDPYNDKALRASKGALFKLNTSSGSVEGLKNLIKNNQLTAFIADTEGKSCEDLQLNSPLVLILGNEAHGPSTEVKALGEKITIPMKGSMESLNVAVAAGILMYTLQAKRTING